VGQQPLHSLPVFVVMGAAAHWHSRGPCCRHSASASLAHCQTHVQAPALASQPCLLRPLQTSTTIGSGFGFGCGCGMPPVVHSPFGADFVQSVVYTSRRKSLS